jgi:hypothetical protein
MAIAIPQTVLLRHKYGYIYIHIAKGNWDTGKDEMYIDVKFVVYIMKSLTQPCFLPEGSATLCGVLPKQKLKRKKNK